MHNVHCIVLSCLNSAAGQHPIGSDEAVSVQIFWSGAGCARLAAFTWSQSSGIQLARALIHHVLLYECDKCKQGQP